MAYSVCLVDCSGQIADKPGIQQRLQQWFGQAAGYHQPPISPVTVGWNNNPTSGVDLVIYFVEDFQHSVVRRLRGFNPPQNWQTAGGLTGLTNPGGNYGPGDIHVSEVYLNRWTTAADLAMAAFHEAMHNQLRVQNEMHVEPRSYGGGIAAEFPPSGTVPTEANLRRIGAVMDLQHAQMLNGYALSQLAGRRGANARRR